MKKNFAVLFLNKFIAWVGVLSLLVMSINFAVASDPTMVKVNGTTIYESPGGYNSEHGISGVTFDTDTKTLNLTSATLESINSNGDLTINLSGNNAVDATESNIAVEVRGNLTVKGSNGSSLNIMAMGADERAIELSVGSTLTIGDAGNLENLITVSIQQGRNVNTVDHTTVVGDNTYNYTAPGGGNPGDPGLPPAGDPLTLSIDGILVIDETATPQITSASGEGWSIEQGFMGGYDLSIDQGVTLGYITGSGDGDLRIIGDGNILENEDSFSINISGRVNISGGMSDVAGDINLTGGISTQGKLNTYDRAFTIGSVDTPSGTGVVASELEVSMGDLTIYTTGTALQYYNQTPGEGEGMLISSAAGKSLTVEASDIATANVISARVSGGGKIDLSYTTSLGTFIPEASHWPWTDMTGTEEENPQPTTVVCEEGTDATNKYKMTTSEGNFLLESMAGTLYQLGWNIPGADDSLVTNGTVKVIAANGYRFTSGGFTDYSIEAGSTVTIELLPDYGYQYVSGRLNGNQTMPDEGKASYTFEMPSGHLHLSAIFEKMDDKISVNTDKVKSASITLPNGEINGNADFEISTAEVADTSSFTQLAGNNTIGGYLDLSLQEVIYKGTSDEAWTTNITDLDKPMTVSLNLADDLQGHTDYVVLRNHNGTVSEIDSAYDVNNKALTFDTDKYSTYAIAYKDSTTAPVANPQTYDGIINQIILGAVCLLGLLGLIIYSKRVSLNS